MIKSVYILILLLFSSYFSFSQQDVGVASVISPVSGCEVGTSNTPINVIVQNFTNFPVSPGNITVRYRVNGGPIVSQVVTTFLLGNASFNFTFSQTQNFTACSQWNIEVWTSYGADIDNSNDTITTTFVNDCNPIPGTYTGPSLLCGGTNSDSIQINGGTFAYGLEWYTQVLPGSFTATGNTNDKIYLNNITDPTNYQVLYAGGLCPDVTSPTFSVGISAPLNTGSVSSDLDFCANSVSGSISLTSFVDVIDFWEESSDGITFTSTGSNANPFDISGYTDTTYFRAFVSSGACGSGYSDTVAVNIEPLVIPGTISGATTVCEGSNSGVLTITGYSNASSLEWYTSTDNIVFTPTGTTTDTYSYLNLTQTTYFKVILTGNLCPSNETTVITVIVDPLVNTGTTSSDLFLCSNNVTGNVSVSGFTSTLTDWVFSTNGGASWSSTGSAANPYDISGISITTDFKAIITSGTCGSDSSATINVSIEPELIPGAISGATSVCSGINSGTLTLIGNANEVSYEWYTSTDNITYIPSGITTPTFSYTNISTTQYFKVILLGNNCPTVETSVHMITVDPPLNTGTASSNLVLCEDNVVGDISISGFSSTINNWTQSTDGGITWVSTGSNANPLTINGITTSTIYVATIGSGACGTGLSSTISVTIQPTVIPGTISGATSVCAGTNAGTLTLSGNANDFGWEWYSSTDNLTFTATGITTPNFNFSNIAQTTYYKVILAGNICNDAETPTVMVSVDPLPDAGTASADLILCEDNVVGSVSLSGITGSIIDWEQSTDGGATWTSTGSNANPLSISGITVSTIYLAVVGTPGCGTTLSSTISVTVEPSVIPGTISGATSVCAGTNSGTMTLSGNANQTGMQWYSSTDNITFTPTGITASTFNFVNVSQTTYYKVILQGNICADVETPVVAVTIDPSLNFGTASPDLFLCETNITGSVSLPGAVTLFDWEQSNDGGFTWVSTGVNTISYDISSLTSSALFRALITSGSCGSGYSDTISVSIEPTVIPGTILGATTVCETANSGTLTLSGNAFDFGYEWYFSTDGVNFFPSGNTGSIFNFASLTEDTYFKVLLQGNICSDAETPVVVVNVDPALDLGSISSDLNLCSNNIAGSVSLSGATTLFDWEQSGDNGLTWFSTGSSATPYDISGLTSSALFRALVSSGVCGSGYSDTISVNIDPQIIIGTVSADTTVCSSANSGSLTLSGNANDYGIEWYSSIDNINFAPTGVTSNVYPFANLTQTTYFKVILQGNVCASQETSVITVTVHPPLNLGVKSTDLNLCANNITGAVSLTGAVTLMDWEQSNDNGISWISTGSNSSSYSITSLTSSALFRAFVSSGVCGAGYSDTISVIIEPEIIVGTITGATTVCGGTNSGTLTLAGNANDFGIQWFSSIDNVNFTATGVTTNTYPFVDLTQTTYYKVVLQGNICSDEETTVTIVTVDPALNLGLASADLNLCADNITGSVQLLGATTLVDWQQSDDNGGTWQPLGNNNSILDISYLNASALFRAFVESGACGSGYSDTISVTIEQPITPGSIAGATTVCATSNSGVLTLTGNANDSGFQWLVSTDNVAFVPSGITTNTYNFSNLTQTTFFKVILYGNACSDAETSVIAVTVDPALVIGVPSPNLILCESNVTGGVSLTGAVTVQNWLVSFDNGVNFVSTGVNNDTLDISNYTASALFVAEVSSGTCGSGFSDTISLTIDQEGVPAVIGDDFAECLGSGQIDTVSVIAHNGTISSWQFSVDGGFTWVSSGSSDSTLIIPGLFGPTLYQLITSHGACPNVSSNTVSGTIATPPVADAGEDATVDEGSSLQLSGSGGVFGIWTPPTYLTDPNATNPLSTPDSSIIYAYTVIDINGCTNTDYVVITVDTNGKVPSEDIEIYNILTTNSDGINDLFIIEGLEKYENNTIRIFNGNGNLLYEQVDYQNDWDGTHNGQYLPDGVYLYAIEVSRVTKHRGFLTIIHTE